MARQRATHLDVSAGTLLSHQTLGRTGRSRLDGQFARDVSVDPAGTVWALSVNQVKGGFQLMRLADKTTKHFEVIEAGAIRLAAA